MARLLHPMPMQLLTSWRISGVAGCFPITFFRKSRLEFESSKICCLASLVESFHRYTAVWLCLFIAPSTTFSLDGLLCSFDGLNCFFLNGNSQLMFEKAVSVFLIVPQNFF